MSSLKMGKRKRQKVEERDPANESASKKQPSQTEEDGVRRAARSRSKVKVKVQRNNAKTKIKRHF